MIPTMHSILVDLSNAKKHKVINGTSINELIDAHIIINDFHSRIMAAIVNRVRGIASSNPRLSKLVGRVEAIESLGLEGYMQDIEQRLINLEERSQNEKSLDDN